MRDRDFEIKFLVFRPPGICFREILPSFFGSTRIRNRLWISLRDELKFDNTIQILITGGLVNKEMFVNSSENVFARLIKFMYKYFLAVQ